MKEMKKRSLTIVVLLILILIISVIVVDFLKSRPDRKGGNPYALEVDQYKKVDPALISHQEARNLNLGDLHGAAMALSNGLLYVAGDSSVVILQPGGDLIATLKIFPSPTGILVCDNTLFLSFRRFVAAYDLSGRLISRWEDLDDRSVITNLAYRGDQIFVADAGNRRVLVYNREGDLQGEFYGEAESDSGHGFIVPSANFDLAVDPYGELWVVDPGRHALENYTGEGRMRGYWGMYSLEPEGFQGCCNPARITVAPDGAFVTSEKGLVRIKIYEASGILRSVVATPDQFKEAGKAPDVCIDSSMVVYALDMDRNIIRIFKPKDHGQADIH
jgi:hypothetical protein